MSGIDEQEEEENIAFYGIITLPGAYSVALSLPAACPVARGAELVARACI